MPEIRISELTTASTPTGTEVLPIVQSGDTYKTTINSLKSALVDNLSTGAPTWTTDGILTAGHDIIAGGNDTGRIALTLNDGYGDANITFNHTGGIPDRSGSSARIVSSVDSTQEVLDFQLKGNVAAGSPVTLTSVLKLYDDSVQLLKPTTLSTNGTTTNSLVNKGYIDTALSGKSDVGHTHSQYSLTTHLHDSRYSQIGHTHSISNITNLQTTLDGKIGETEINSAHFTFTNNTLSLKTIQEGQIATDAVTSTKIGTGAVTSTKIGTDAVTSTKIGTGAVTPGKLSTGAPNWSTNGALTTGNIFTNGEAVEVNYWGSGDRNAYIDFHSQGAVGDSGYDYDARLFRYPGVDGKFELTNKGTGPITVDRTIAQINTNTKSIATKEYVDTQVSSSITRHPISSPSLSACTKVNGIKYVYAGLVGSSITYYNQHGGSNAVEAHGTTSFSIDNSINVGTPYNTIHGVTVRVTIEQVDNTGGGFKAVTFLTDDGEIMQQTMMPYTLRSSSPTPTTTVAYVYVPIPKGMPNITMWADYFYGRSVDRVTIRAGLSHLYVS